MPAKLKEGPYIYRDKIHYQTRKNRRETFRLDPEKPIEVHVGNLDKDKFSVRLSQDDESSLDVFTMPKKLVAMADIEGNFDGLAGFLQSNKIIDKDFNWSFGKGHFVLNGDLVDRSANVTGVLWLLYKMEMQARSAGGRVHIILGNHDLMNMQGWCEFANPRFQKTLQILTGESDLENAFKTYFSPETFLGKWLSRKNIILKIGNLLFVHAGVSSDVIQQNLSIEQINNLGRMNLYMDNYRSRNTDKVVDAIMGEKGLMWYRGLARPHTYPMESKKKVKKILRHFGVDKIIVGHSVVDDICTGYDGMVVKIDVLHGQTKKSGETRGLWVEDQEYSIVDDYGDRRNLEMS